MALTDTTLNSMADHLATLCPYASLHSADPGTTGTSETTAARQAVSFNVAANGDISLSSAVTFTGGTGGGDVLYVGLWSAVSGGTFRGAFPLTGDASFSAGGEYTLNSLTISGTSS